MGSGRGILSETDRGQPYGIAGKTRQYFNHGSDHNRQRRYCTPLITITVDGGRIVIMHLMVCLRTRYHKFRQERTVGERERRVRGRARCPDSRIGRRGQCEMDDGGRVGHFGTRLRGRRGTDRLQGQRGGEDTAGGNHQRHVPGERRVFRDQTVRHRGWRQDR